MLDKKSWRVAVLYNNLSDDYDISLNNGTESFFMHDEGEALDLCKYLNYLEDKVNIMLQDRNPNIDDSRCKDINDHLQEMFTKNSRYYYGKTNKGSI